MKHLILMALTILMAAGIGVAQTKDEAQIAAMMDNLNKAYVARQIAPFEAAFAEDFTGVYPDGLTRTRAEILKEMKDEIAKPTGKSISETWDNMKVRVNGNAASVMARWTSVSQSLEPGAEPHTDHGGYVAYLEKRDGKWLLVSEAMSEAQHDRKLMEQQVLAAGSAYDAIMKSRDKAAYERMLHKDYLYTTDEGKLISRADDIARFSSGDITINTVEVTDKKVRIAGNTSAVETGQYHVTGTFKGKAFEETGRYTTTWVWRDLRWQILADHNSIVKK